MEISTEVKVHYPLLIHNNDYCMFYTIDPLYEDTVFNNMECTVKDTAGAISAVCDYSGNNSSVTGFQIIVQLNNADEVHKLYINSTTEHQVTVQVEENGTYHVAIFLIMGESGIMDTTIAYSQDISVSSKYINIHHHITWKEHTFHLATYFH